MKFFGCLTLTPPSPQNLGERENRNSAKVLGQGLGAFVALGCGGCSGSEILIGFGGLLVSLRGFAYATL